MVPQTRSPLTYPFVPHSQSNPKSHIHSQLSQPTTTTLLSIHPPFGYEQSHPSRVGISITMNRFATHLELRQTPLIMHCREYRAFSWSMFGPSIPNSFLVLVISDLSPMMIWFRYYKDSTPGLLTGFTFERGALYIVDGAVTWDPSSISAVEWYPTWTTWIYIRRPHHSPIFPLSKMI